MPGSSKKIIVTPSQQGLQQKTTYIPPGLAYRMGLHKNILEFSSKRTERRFKMKIFDVVQPKETDKVDDNTGQTSN